MSRVLDVLVSLDYQIDAEEIRVLRLAALLHDIGHYPYSHLLEGVDSVILTEELSSKPELDFVSTFKYPEHEELGRRILTQRMDLVNILGEERAKKIGAYFSGHAYGEQQITKLLHSSLDMDRMDYLLRDGQATGVPYGKIDIHYLLNHIQVGKNGAGTIGISLKALPAAEHFLLARAFSIRTICQHKTVHGFEEAARQLLRRLKNRAASGGEGYGTPKDQDEILDIIQESAKFNYFTDSFVDDIVRNALNDSDIVIKTLAQCVGNRIPPILLWEHKTFKKRQEGIRDTRLFTLTSQNGINSLAERYGIHSGHFLLAATKPVGFEKRGSTMHREEAKQVDKENAVSQAIRVFESDTADEPTEIIDLPQSLLHEIGGHAYHAYRVYLVPPNTLDKDTVPTIKSEVQDMYNTVFMP